MLTEKLLSEVILGTANAVTGGLLVVLALMAAFVVVGQALLMVRRIRASRVKRTSGHDHVQAPATSGAAVAAD
ncbi:MAG: hypothetical protein EPN47_09475 [Acidobacteria bacterium]|nr:MAG: hypothetical protein EPN47_09475 [Acidobacteriota bacterium]